MPLGNNAEQRHADDVCVCVRHRKVIIYLARRTERAAPRLIAEAHPTIH